MTKYHINVFYRDEDGGYIVDTPDLNALLRPRYSHPRR